MTVLAGACGGGGSSGSTTPTAEPSDEANQLFAKAVAAMESATSLRYDYRVFEGDKVVFTIVSEQAAPDKARRVTDDKNAGVTTEAVIIGAEVCQKASNEQKPHCITLDPNSGEQPFAFPQSWVQENGSLTTGWAVVGPDDVDGTAATLIRNWHADASTGEDAYSEELVYIDNATGRVVRWNINKYRGQGSKPKLTQRWESGSWQYNAPIEISLEGFEGG